MCFGVYLINALKCQQVGPRLNVMSSKGQGCHALRQSDEPHGAELTWHSLILHPQTWLTDGSANMLPEGQLHNGWS